MSLLRWIVSELKGPEGQVLVASAEGTGSVVTAYLDVDDPAQQWMVMGNLYGGGFQGLFWNQESEAYLCAPDDDGPVTLCPNIDPTSMWTAAQSGNDYALRPYRNDDQNLNIAGSATQADNPIYVWSWGGGQPNEVWDIEAYEGLTARAAAGTA